MLVWFDEIYLTGDIGEFVYVTFVDNSLVRANAAD
jgi:hypothetical protein